MDICILDAMFKFQGVSVYFTYFYWTLCWAIVLKIGRFHWSFVDAPPLRLMHIGKKETLGLIELMEGRFDELFLFDPAMYGMEGQVGGQIDPQQQYGVRGKLPKLPPQKLKEQRSLRSDEMGFDHDFELKATEDYLKANTADPTHPLTLFRVSGHLYTNIGHLYRTLVTCIG